MYVLVQVLLNFVSLRNKELLEDDLFFAVIPPLSEMCNDVIKSAFDVRIEE